MAIIDTLGDAFLYRTDPANMTGNFGIDSGFSYQEGVDTSFIQIDHTGQASAAGGPVFAQATEEQNLGMGTSPSAPGLTG